MPNVIQFCNGLSLYAADSPDAQGNIIVFANDVQNPQNPPNDLYKFTPYRVDCPEWFPGRQSPQRLGYSLAMYSPHYSGFWSPGNHEETTTAVTIVRCSLAEAPVFTFLGDDDDAGYVVIICQTNNKFLRCKIDSNGNMFFSVDGNYSLDESFLVYEV